MTLKTLKDFEDYEMPCNKRFYESDLYDELKQSAIKHIKDNDDVFHDLPEFNPLPTGGKIKWPKRQNTFILSDGTEIIIGKNTNKKIKLILNDWIKQFFNITEKDLK